MVHGNHIYTYAWINSVGLKDYLISKGRLVFVTDIRGLVPGDIIFLSDYSHVVMYTKSYPVSYSGHTNDRKNHPYDPALKNSEWLIEKGNIRIHPAYRSARFCKLTQPRSCSGSYSCVESKIS